MSSPTLNQEASEGAEGFHQYHPLPCENDMLERTLPPQMPLQPSHIVHLLAIATIYPKQTKQLLLFFIFTAKTDLIESLRQALTLFTVEAVREVLDGLQA